MATNKKEFVNLSAWLVEKTLLKNECDTKALASSVQWVKRNLPSVKLISPRRGEYVAVLHELEVAYEAHMLKKDETLTAKQKEARKLNAKNRVVREENARREKAGLEPMTTKAERDEFFASSAGSSALAAILAESDAAAAPAKAKKAKSASKKSST